MPELSRARVQTLLLDGRIRVDGKPAKPAQRLRAGQRVSVSVPLPEPALPQPEAIPLKVLFEDAQLLVLDKPAGLVVHPGAGRGTGTLVNALLFHVKDLSGVGGVLRPGIVHRLDRGTSGLMVVAKNDAAHRALAAQFASRRVEKEYLALVLGVPARRTGEITAPIGRDPVHRRRMSVRAARGREARSRYEVVRAFANAALLRVLIFTGRTHQVRVHLASIGHPIAGDATYGGKRALLPGLARPALHAARLAFEHPESGERLEFRSPLPADLDALLSSLR
jgi:23S rRNA pseudouridine1911/1915/1917 synthase